VLTLTRCVVDMRGRFETTSDPARDLGDKEPGRLDLLRR
jgi:hypothetical protein